MISYPRTGKRRDFSGFEDKRKRDGYRNLNAKRNKQPNKQPDGYSPGNVIRFASLTRKFDNRIKRMSKDAVKMVSEEMDGVSIGEWHHFTGCLQAALQLHFCLDHMMDERSMVPEYVDESEEGTEQ